jgi:hypothetical protein
MAPVVTGDVNIDALEDLVRLCVELDARRDSSRLLKPTMLQQSPRAGNRTSRAPSSKSVASPGQAAVPAAGTSGFSESNRANGPGAGERLGDQGVATRAECSFRQLDRP